jgi:hypothetical protein
MTDVVECAPELATEAMERGTLVLLVADDLPGGFWILDERVGMCCRDPETELSRAVVDTDTAAALAHAQSLYEAYTREAIPFDAAVFATG